MRVPAVWMVAAFAAGIAVSGRWPGAAVNWLGAAAAAIVAAGVLLWLGRLAPAWALALAAWAALGGVAQRVERAAIPANNVTRLMAAGKLDVSEPLRWRGRLREDPLALPWGQRYELDLEQVESSGGSVPISGGLRANLYAERREREAADASAAPAVRAGDRVELLLRARPPRNFLDPGAFDLRGYLARQKIDLLGTLRSGELLEVIARPPPTISQRLARIRGDLLARLDSLFAGQPERLAVLRAMLLGDRSFVESHVALEFQKIAAYHVLVVAGLHAGALVVFLLWLCRRLHLPLWAGSIVTVTALAAYVGVVQDRPPILRAALMAVLYLCARPLFRRVDLLNGVALAALVLLAWKPSSLTDSSFELSFLAAGVIAGLALPWIDRTSVPYRAGLKHLGDVTRDALHAPKVAQFRIETRAAGRWLAARSPAWLAPRTPWLTIMPIRAALRLWEIVLLSFAIQWGMMPLLALDFHRVSLAGPVSNIPAVILTGIIVPLGFVTLATSCIWTRLAVALAKPLGLCAGLLLAVVNWFSGLPRISYRIPGPPVWLIAAFFVALVLLVAAARAARPTRRANRARQQPAAPPSAASQVSLGAPPGIRLAEWIAASALAALTILIASYPFAPHLDRSRLEVTVLDVGQGDSIFAALPGGRTMLVDGGGLAGSEWIGGYRSGFDVGEEVVSPYLWSRGLKRLDVVALTHADHDHIDGLYAVLENFHVGELWVGCDDPRPAFERLLAEARARGVPVVHKAHGDDAGSANGASTEVLWPRGSTPDEKSPNDDSLVMRLSDGRVHFLLTGDIGERAERELVSDGDPIAADFLKVPHHGSKTSSTEEFVAAVAPRAAVASVGEGNPFGHPAESVVERYENAGVRFFRTDRDGAVTALTDGQSLITHTFIEGNQP